LYSVSSCPSLTTIGLTYGVHRLKGTPEPERSTIPTVIVAPLGTAFWGSRKRNQRDSLDDFLDAA